MLSEKSKSIIEHRLGQTIDSPHACSALQIDIEKSTGDSLGLNTLKRVFGIIEAGRKPHVTTLNVLARYAGYKSWAHLLQDIGEGADSDFDEQNEIYSDEIPDGATVTYSYGIDRRITLQHILGDEYVVEQRSGGKLKVNDHLHIRYFMLGAPLYVENVVRGGYFLGHYVAGKHGGLKNIVIE